jgi:ribosome recycling factor
MQPKFHLEAKEAIAKCLTALQHTFDNQLSTKLHPNILSGMKIIHDGEMMHLNHIANLTLLDPVTLSVQPWDKHTLRSIEKSLQKNTLGLSITSPGNGAILVRMPSLTTEKRREWGKVAKTFGEEAKITVRRIRRNCLDKIEALPVDSEQSKQKKQLETIIQHANDTIKQMVENKQRLLEKL